MAFTYGIKLAGFKDKIWVKELPGRLYRDLVKSLYNNDETAFIQHLNYVIEHVSPGILQEGLNVIDKIILLLHMRSICISPDLNLNAKCPTANKKFETTAKLEKMIEKLEKLTYSKVIDVKTIRIEHSIVKARDEIAFATITPDLKFTYLLASCIDKVTAQSIAGDKILVFNKLSFEERLKSVEGMPVNLSKQVYESILEIDKELNQTKLLTVTSPYVADTKVVDLPASLDPKVCLEFCKLLFNDDLFNLYKLTFNLVSKAHFSPEYTDSIPPAEQLLYWNLFCQAAQKEKEEIEGGKTSGGPSFDGITIPPGKTTPSEFTG